MDVKYNIVDTKDGDPTRPHLAEAPPIVDVGKLEGTVKKKRRRGKSKRKILKPFMKIPWQERRNYDKTKRNNRFRKIVLAKTHAPFNNNQFLMEIHKPEPENNFQILHTPSARTRDSSFSVDSEENYFYSLPEDEEEYLTKEFSSVYEDAQSERLSNMSKNDLIQEYLLLEAKYDNLVKRTERSRKGPEDYRDVSAIDKDTSNTDKDSMVTERNTSVNSTESSGVDDISFDDVMQRMKEQEDQIRELQLANEKLKVENERLRKTSHSSSSEDSESDSSTTSVSDSSSSRSSSPIDSSMVNGTNGEIPVENHIEQNGHEEIENFEPEYPLVNGFHNSNDATMNGDVGDL